MVEPVYDSALFVLEPGLFLRLFLSEHSSTLLGSGGLGLRGCRESGHVAAMSSSASPGYGFLAWEGFSSPETPRSSNIGAPCATSHGYDPPQFPRPLLAVAWEVRIAVPPVQIGKLKTWQTVAGTGASL